MRKKGDKKLRPALKPKPRSHFNEEVRGIKKEVKKG